MKYCPLCGKEYAEGDVCERDGAVLIIPQVEAADLVGQVLKGTYRVEEKIGQGGMAAVYRGVQMPLERDVAIKVLLPNMQSSPSMIQRFFKEAKVLCRLSHPHVVSIFDFGNTETGLAYMVMEFLDGMTLRQNIPLTGLTESSTKRLMRQICAGVGAAHLQGLIHRDLKPDNIFITAQPDGTEHAKILDFGIARAMEGDHPETRLTQTGLVMGTPGFLAPEQIGGASEADARSDIYALGAILYLMLTGHHPYAGKTPSSILIQQLKEPPNLKLGQLAVRDDLAAVIRRAMHHDPDQRFQTPDELLAALDNTSGPSSAVDPAAETVAMSSPEPAETVATQLLSADRSTPAAGVPVAGNPAAGAPVAGTKGPLPWIAGGIGLVAIAALAFFFTGRSDRAAPELESTARGVSSERILVGMSAVFSGPSKELGRGMRLGVEACFEEVNAQGGAHGRNLELVALDDGYEPSRTVANMADLLLQRQVFAILGNVGTPTAEVAIPLAQEEKAPFVGGFTGADLLRPDPPNPFIFNYRASYADETSAIVQYFLDVRGLQPSEIVVFAQEDGFGDDGYRGVVDTLKERGFDDEVPRVGYRRNRHDVDDAAERLRQDHPNAKGLIMVAPYRPAAELIQILRTDVSESSAPDLIFAGLSFIGSRALAEELGELGPGYAEGVIVTQVVPHYESDLPGVERYREAMSSHFPSEQLGFVSLEGYLACRTFVAGLEQAGPELTVDGFIAAMESLNELDLGIGTLLRIGPDRHQGSDRVWGTELDGDVSYQTLDLKP